jgi:hypothetical protein
VLNCLTLGLGSERYKETSTLLVNIRDLSNASIKITNLFHFFYDSSLMQSLVLIRSSILQVFDAEVFIEHVRPMATSDTDCRTVSTSVLIILF